MSESEVILARLEERDEQRHRAIKRRQDDLLTAMDAQRKTQRDTMWRIITIGIAALSMAAALASFVFVTESEAAVEHGKIEAKIQDARVNAAVVDEKIKEDRKKLEAVYDYVKQRSR